MRVRLEPIRRSDLKPLLDWVSTPEELVQWSGPWNFTFPLDEDQLAQFFLSDRSADGLGRIQYKAVDVESQSMVGQIGFGRIWESTNTGRVGPVIVAPAARSQGIGQQMMRQILRIGFEQLQLHRIDLVVFTFNQAAVACYEKAGFQSEGVMRDIVQVGGEYWHWRVMSVLRPEWVA